MQKNIAIAAVALASCCGVAQAQSNNIVRAGVTYIDIRADVKDITGPFVPAGVKLDVKDATTLFFSYARRINEQFEVELAGGWPPEHDVVGKGPATLGSVPYDGQVVAKVKQFAPTVFVNYKILGEGAGFRPFVGLGINYTRFFDRKSTEAGNAGNGGPTAIGMTSSTGPAAQVGFSYALAGDMKGWTVNGAFAMAKVKSDVTITTAGTERRTTIDFNPRVYIVSMGYAF